MICDRCRCKTTLTIMSMFNQDILCPECKDAEEQHPAYADAVAAELRQVQAGNYNYPGIGRPADL
jgi:hypothetical protein